MNMSIGDIALTAAVIGNGLLAGLFFAFSCAVVLALRKVDDRAYVATFRAINSSILNGWFLLVFLAAPASAVLATIFGAPDDGATWGLVLVGSILSVLTFGITAVGNVPLNRGLDEAVSDTDAQRGAARQAFETRWNRWNLARTLTSVAAFICLVMAIA